MISHFLHVHLWSAKFILVSWVRLSLTFKNELRCENITPHIIHLSLINLKCTFTICWILTFICDCIWTFFFLNCCISLYINQYQIPFFFSLLGLHLWHVEILGLGGELETLLVYTTATAMPDPSHVCDLHHGSGQCGILNPLSKARDCTGILMGTTWVHYHRAMVEIPTVPNS